jgi:hypothetical protein
MNISEIKSELSGRGEYSSDVAFNLCREVALAWQNPTVDASDSIDLIVRLVSVRERVERAASGIGQMINDILRQAGLFPYMENDDRWTNQLAQELMRVPSMPDITLHLEQMKVFGLLISGKSLILSAPTSFGKSLLVDALISSKEPPCVVIVVPTLALLDEYRKRLRERFRQYDIITQDYQQPIGPLTIYVGTQERIQSRNIIEKVNLSVIDEFYKLDLERGDDRALSLNAVMARYATTADQIYLLGPSIDSISSNIHFPKQLTFHKTSFSPVATDIIDYTASGPNIPDLVSVLRTVQSEPTLVYVRSPQSAAKLAHDLLRHIGPEGHYLGSLGDWLGEQFHPEWMLAKSIKNGIGIHHGRVPRSIGQYIIHLFNVGELPILICTSTLIEGVNTSAKNVVIYDKFISTRKLDRFTFDNIKGRAGRMFEHYVGRVFLFNPPPDTTTFGVDIPLFDGFERASDELLVHVPADTLGPAARRKRDQIVRTSSLSPELLQRWSRFGIDGLNSLRDQIEMHVAAEDNDFIWNGYGNFKQIQAAISLGWNDLTFEKHGMKSSRQAAFFATVLRRSSSLRAFFDRLVQGTGLAAQESIDSCFNFLRGAEYTFPEVLRATEDVINEVSEGLVDYSYFARSLQGWFLPGNLRTLEEFGVPMPIIQKLGTRLPEENPDEALDAVRIIANQSAASLDPVERDILNVCLS